MMHQPARDLRWPGFDPTLLLAFLLPIFAWAPLTYPGYFVLRSGYLPVFSLTDRLAHLTDVTWAPVVGKSYSLLGGDGNLPYLLGALISGAVGGPPNAVKWVLGLSLIAGSAGSYFWTRRRLGDGWPALVAAALYVFSPIWLAAVYTSGAFAETVLLGLMPWVLFAADAALHGRKGSAIALTLLAACAMWTQAALAVVFLVLVVAYLLLLRRLAHVPSARFALAAIGLAGGFVLGCLGLLPVILRGGMGASDLAEIQWPVLLVPWLALLGGWIAARLGAMLSEQERNAKPALFAALIGLVLLAVYGDQQPVASSGVIPGAPLAIFGENEIALLSVQTEGTPGPGGRVAIDVEWQALKPVTHDYTVFFHVMSGDQRYGQQDTMPQSGKLPTTQWQPGEVVRDRYEVVLSPDAPIEAPYEYWLGWYLGETGQRLTAVTSGGQDDKYVIKP